VTLPRLSSRPPGPGERTSPGARNRWVTFNNPANPTAGVVASAAFDSWAAFRALGGAEIDKAQQFAQRSTHLVTVAYQPVEENMTISMNEAGTVRTFQIEYIEDVDERHDELRIMCFEMNQNAGSAQ
jgi:head-tail adaptor